MNIKMSLPLAIGLITTSSIVAAATFTIEKNEQSFSIDGNVGARQGQQVYLYSTDTDNANQNWEQISHGDGYYSYKKQDTNLCWDGGNGGRRRQAVTLEACDSDNYDQHWLKITANSTSETYRFEKRNAPDWSIDGNSGAENLQPVYLWKSDDSNVNQQWSLIRTDEGSEQHVVLISIDGYRYDYTELHQAANIAKAAEKSAIVTRLTPSFPTLTFPNHMTLITGLYPKNHGIVDNEFYNAELGLNYSYKNSANVTNGDFYKGMPLWSLARDQGLKSASYFWVGSEAEIGGYRPDYYEVYDGSVSNQARVDQVVEWLSLPEDERPQFTALYFSIVDSKGHSFGPESTQVYDAVQEVDHVIGDLIERLDELDIDINVIITADHGMVDASQFPRALTNAMLNVDGDLKTRISLSGTGALAHITSSATTDEQREIDLDAFGDIVTSTNPTTRYYKLGEVPEYLHYDGNESIGDAIIISDEAYLIRNANVNLPTGHHGFDTEHVDEMNTVLYGYGPAFDETVVIDQADNIHVYPLIAEILGLEVKEPIDGELSVLSPMLK